MSELLKLIDLASARVGGRALATSDDFFAEVANMLRPEPPVFIDGKYTDRGKWMDGWESRRRRDQGHDWAIVRLGLSGIIRAINVDTTHFRGNAPESCSIEACTSDDGFAESAVTWHELLPRTPVEAHSHNVFEIDSNDRVTHLRLHIYPDGGVARLRVHGDVLPDWDTLARNRDPLDMLAVEQAGCPLACSDEFFGVPHNLIMPGRGVNMGDGWETRRRRGPGHDWVILRTGRPTHLTRLCIDTCHFKGNYPDRASVEISTDPYGTDLASLTFAPLLNETKLDADHEHWFDVQSDAPTTHIRLNIYPDGGVSRFRAFGVLA